MCLEKVCRSLRRKSFGKSSTHRPLRKSSAGPQFARRFTTGLSIQYRNPFELKSQTHDTFVNTHLSEWNPQRSQSSSSRSPVSLAVPVRIIEQSPKYWPQGEGQRADILQAPVVVSHKCASSSWTILPVLSSVTSRAQVRIQRQEKDRTHILTPGPVKEDDILCLLESEREARRLR